MKARWTAYPYYVWMVIFIMFPLFLILYYAFTRTIDGQLVFTLDNFKRVFTPIYLAVIRRSLTMAFLCTLLCFILGYPVSYILSKTVSKNKSLLLFLFIVPMWMNFLLRTYSWLSLLENNGLINTVLVFLNLPKLNILYTDQAVLLGMVYNYLPFMILPIYTVIDKIDKNVIEAAQDLGSDGIRVFTKVIFPLSLPGVISGVTMVFMPAVTTFIISNLLGGGQYILIGNLIERQFLNIGDWNLGSAIAVMLMVLILISMAVFSLVDKEQEGGALM